MDSLSNRTFVLTQLAEKMREISSDDNFLEEVEAANPWFIKRFVRNALLSIADQMLSPSIINHWMNNYTLSENNSKIGVIAAGNIPLVSFHDILCVYLSGNEMLFKLSSKDMLLTSRVLNEWISLDTEWKSRLQIVDKISKCDKIIATGSNTSFQYFQHYFSQYPHILRKNRTSIGLVPRDLSDNELELLMDDIFLYFGLGCRNVSKIWIEKGFDLHRIMEKSEKYKFLFDHQKYMNNYDYRRTLLMMNNEPHLSNDFLILKEDHQIYSPISTLHYQWYEKEESPMDEFNQKAEEIQCVVGRGYISFGNSQYPSPEDYADGVDTMKFLMDNPAR